MTSLLLKVALAAALTIASVVGLIAISGSIIFADIKAPEPASVVQDQRLEQRQAAHFHRTLQHEHYR